MKADSDTTCESLYHCGEAAELEIGAVTARVAAGAVALADGFISIRCLKKRRGAIVYRELPIPNELAEALRLVHDLGSMPSSRAAVPGS